MTYTESFPAIITHGQLVEVVKEHYLLEDIEDFYSVFGLKNEYRSIDLLNWLGY